MVKTLMLSSLIMVAGSAVAADFKVSSPELQSGRFGEAQVMSGFGCSVHHQSAGVVSRKARKALRCLFMTVMRRLWHWVMVDIPADVHELAAGAGNDTSLLPSGAIQTYNDALQPGYIGPCPPVGEKHRYLITVFALPMDKLGVGEQTSGAMVGFMVNAKALGKATFTARYQR